MPCAAKKGEPIKVAWIIAGDEGYGVRRMVMNLGPRLGPAGQQPSVVSLCDGPFAEVCRRAGLPVVCLELKAIPSLRRGLRDLPQVWQFQGSTSRRLCGTLKNLGASAVHVIWPNLVALAGAAARGCGAACLWEMPNIVGSGYPLHLNRWAYQAACWRYGVQPLAISRFVAKTLGFWPVRPEVVYLGVDERRFNPDGLTGAAKSQLGISPEAVVLGIVARLEPSKGQDRILAAMLDVQRESRVPLHLVLVGGPVDSPFAEQLRQTAGRAGAADRLHLVGVVNDPERYYPLVDVAINSRVDPEPFGLSVVEAMMMRVPVLAHALGGPAETVLDGATGWLVQEPTVAAFAEGLRRALRDQACWRAMGLAGRERALACFSLEVQTRRYLKILDDLLNQRRVRADNDMTSAVR